jgi:ABC-2 type transport system permease protein
MRATPNLFIASLRMLLRDTTALIGTVAFPVLFVLVFSLFDLAIVPGGDLGVGAGAGRLDYFDFVLPGLLALGLMNFTMVGIAGSVARFRETGILRRMNATPLSPSSFILAQVAARLVLALAQTGLMLGLGVVLGATVRGSVVWLLLLASIGNLTFLSLGFAVAGRAASVDAANNMAGLATFPLMFLSGMFFPLAAMPRFVQWVAEALPITPLVSTMRAVALEGAAPGDLGLDLVTMLLWVPVSLVLARLSFRMAEA